MPAYNKRPYAKSTRVTIRGVVKRPYRQSGGYGGSVPMQVVTSGIAPLRTGGFFGTRRTMHEKKTVDVDTTAVSVNTTPSLTLLNGIAAGTDFTDRIGRKVILKSLQIRYGIEPTDQIVGVNHMRFLIVYDRQTNGAAPIITDILKASSPFSQMNLNNRDRFQVLWDKVHVQPFAANTATQAVSFGQTVWCGKKYRTLKHEMIFGGTAATVASIQTGSIYLLAVGTNTATADSTFIFNTRIRFIDA